MPRVTIERRMTTTTLISSGSLTAPAAVVALGGAQGEVGCGDGIANGGGGGVGVAVAIAGAAAHESAGIVSARAHDAMPALQTIEPGASCPVAASCWSIASGTGPICWPPRSYHHCAVSFMRRHRSGGVCERVAHRRAVLTPSRRGVT